MTVKLLNDLQVPIGEVLQSLGAQGGLLEIPGNHGYAVLPLDDDLIDFLLERNSRLTEECQQIRQRMQAGQFHSHEEVRKVLGV